MRVGAAGAALAAAAAAHGARPDTIHSHALGRGRRWRHSLAAGPKAAFGGGFWLGRNAGRQDQALAWPQSRVRGDAAHRRQAPPAPRPTRPADRLRLDLERTARAGRCSRTDASRCGATTRAGASLCAARGAARRQGPCRRADPSLPAPAPHHRRHPIGRKRAEAPAHGLANLHGWLKATLSTSASGGSKKYRRPATRFDNPAASRLAFARLAAIRT